MVRRMALAVTMGLVAGLATAAPNAGAQTCTHDSSAYSDAGAPGTGPVNDPLFPRQWGLTQIKAPAAWTRGAHGSGATIAVIDTGADLSHPDLQANLVPGADFVPGGGDCPGAQDENGHGTHVSGIAAAVTNNGVGVAGTAPDAKVMPLRALDADGSGEDPWIVAAIHHAADNGAKVINMSLGGLPVVGQAPQLNQEMEEAVAYAWSKGVTIVAAAGNETFPLCSYPAAARYAICVAATDRRGAPSYYSNFPDDPDQTVGVRAPGGAGSPFCEDDEDIWSTIWPGSDFDCQGDGSLSGYDTLAGTSMASPFAAGLAAMLSGQGLTNAQIMECFKTTSSNKGGFDPVYGYGIIDADAATATCAPQTTPSYAPTQTAASGDGSGSTGSTPTGQSGGGSSGTGGGSGTGSPDAGGLTLQATVLRATRASIIRTGLVKVRLTANRPVSGRLAALVTRRGHRALRVGSKRFTLTKAGSRTVRIRLTRRGLTLLRRSRSASLRVKYAAPGARGYAATAAPLTAS